MSETHLGVGKGAVANDPVAGDLPEVTAVVGLQVGCTKRSGEKLQS